jgi:hypothetical protein
MMQRDKAGHFFKNEQNLDWQGLEGCGTSGTRRDIFDFVPPDMSGTDGTHPYRGVPMSRCPKNRGFKQQKKEVLCVSD